MFEVDSTGVEYLSGFLINLGLGILDDDQLHKLDNKWSNNLLDLNIILFIINNKVIFTGAAGNSISNLREWK